MGGTGIQEELQLRQLVYIYMEPQGNCAVPCEQTCSPISDISILALQFEHLTVGRNTDDRADASITVAIPLTMFSSLKLYPELLLSIMPDISQLRELGRGKMGVRLNVPIASHRRRVCRLLHWAQ